MFIDSMEKDYFKFVSTGLKANYKILKQIIDKYSIEEVNKGINDLRILYKKSENSKAIYELDPNTMFGVMLIPRFVPIIESYNNERAERQQKKNTQINKRYFCLTITTPHKYSADEVDLYVHGFVTSKTFSDYIYCIEHIHKNIHAHIVVKLDAHVQALKPAKLLQKFKIYNQKSKHEFDLTLKDTSGNCHYLSKTFKQCLNYIKYICKAEPDKNIFMTGILIRKYELDWTDKITNNYSEEDFKLLSHYMEKECQADTEDEED